MGEVLVEVLEGFVEVLIVESLLSLRTLAPVHAGSSESLPALEELAKVDIGWTLPLEGS